MTIVPLLPALAIVPVGILLAVSQFCMVRAVLGVRAGDLSPARCVLAISLAIALSLMLLAAARGGETMPTTSPQLPVLLGGLLFGIAARANGGCFVGSTNELCRGHWRRESPCCRVFHDDPVAGSADPVEGAAYPADLFRGAPLSPVVP